MKNKFLIISFLLSTVALFAQSGNETSVLVSNSVDGSTVKIKWIKETFLDVEAVDVYRKNSNGGDWEKINDEVIQKQEVMTEPEGGKSSVSNILEEELAKTAIEELDGFILFMLVTETMVSNEFAAFIGNYYEDQTVEAGQSYTYKVQYANNGEIVAESESITAAPYQPAPPPNDFNAYADEADDKKIKVIWKPEEEKYFAVNIWRTEVGAEKKRKMNTTPVLAMIKDEKSDGTIIYPDFFFESKQHEYGKTYAYQAETISFFGEIGQLSDTIQITVIDRTPPPIPNDVDVTKKGLRQAWIIWSDVDTTNVAGYNVLVGRGPEGPFQQSNETLLPPNAGSYTHTIEEFGSHFFKLEVVSKSGVTSASAVRPLDLLDEEPPEMPQNVAVTPDTGFVNITWNPVAADDLMGYYVYRSIRADESVPFERVTVEPLTSPTFRDKVKKNAKNIFYYKVSAIDTSYNMSPRTEPLSVQLPDVTPPNPPVLIQAKASVTAVNLKWLPIFADDLDKCEVYRRTAADDATWELLNSLDTTTTYTDNTVAANTAYQYKIRAIDQSGNASEFSNTYNARTKPDKTPMEGADKISANYQKKKKQVTIKWKEDAEDRKGSVVFRKSSTGRLVALSPMISNKAVFVDKKIEAGMTYTYIVKTYFNNGKVGASEPEVLEVTE